MLQPMPSPSCLQVGEDTTISQYFEGRLFGDFSSRASSDNTEDLDLPQCTHRRNYNCSKCNFYTQNPRDFLLHSREIHFEKFKIYDCPNCLYASRHHQKLLRHVKMVHREKEIKASIKMPLETFADVPEPADRIEDYLEEVEELDVEEDFTAETLDSENRTVTDEHGPSNGAKGNYFSCNKCSYVTHIKSRYTKHVKYHSMPMIKCTICDFRTPYKWNLDRHMKNHGGTGSFYCSMCNFTADIKQSLTVHEMNHHTPPVGQIATNRRRNRVGASDMIYAEDTSMALITKEEESGDSRSSAADMGANYADIEMISCNSESNDGTATESVANNEDSDAAHNATEPSSGAADEHKANKQSKKAPRPIPQLIPLNTSTPNQSKNGEPPAKKFKDMSNDHPFNPPAVLENTSPDLPQLPVTNQPPAPAPARKKNESFFDRLKERLLTETGENGSLTCKNCGFESKCLSEHSVHEKTCAAQASKVSTNTPISSLSSTRCQNCRHRCKSSADLFVHLQTCGRNMNEQTQETAIKDTVPKSVESSTPERDAAPHPMENVVFVWNINHDEKTFQTPLDISINDDSTMPDRSHEQENVDENEGLNLSPSQAAGKKVFKCPHCLFWASTASRFHVHIVGHLNKKPFECSLCKYKSNWRWDITKHIKLKSARDPEHNNAKVLMTDETGRRNYSKYNKFLATSIPNEAGENKFQYIDQEAAAADGSMEVDDSMNEESYNQSQDVQPLDLHTQQNDAKKIRKTFWKCRKCHYKDPSKEALLEHIRDGLCRPQDGQHDDKAKKAENIRDPADLAYRCGHCNQLSNWKHVIQRHCRLKHDGVIKVVAIEKSKLENTIHDSHHLNEGTSDFCPKCPYKENDKKQLMLHLQQHNPSPQSIFKCYFCPFFVKNESELTQHLILHGVTDPEEYVAKTMDGKVEPTLATKRHKCIECPYETNSKSQYMYHEQFHRLPADTPYKCPECNYSVSKRHLLHQHLRVHGITTKKLDDLEQEASTSMSFKSDGNTENPISLQEIPFVWVAAKNEFHKMYKCRYCPYVNTQKCKIPNHEKIHCITFENNDVTVFKCFECKFTCDDAFILVEHSKVHGEIYGRIYFAVKDDVPEEEQISKLRKLIEEEKAAVLESLAKDDSIPKEKEGKLLHFCQKCPARFFSATDVIQHEKFHKNRYVNKCNCCEFTRLLQSELAPHLLVHSDEYQKKTKMLKIVHEVHQDYKEPKFEPITLPGTSDIVWVVTDSERGNGYIAFIDKIKQEKKYAPTPKQYSCKECPAKFFKSSALNYHVNLHGGEGDYKCRKCSYTVKNIGNLAKHELIHENYDSGDDMDYKNVPLSGTDLFQRKTEAQKRVHIDKDKLVKPNDHFPPVLQADPQFGYLMHGNPEFIYPTYLKNGRQKEKRYKCHKCPSAFEKREQYKIHLSLHGSKQRYKCELCDYSVKYYANYVQHMRKHQMNDEALAERKKENGCIGNTDGVNNIPEDSTDNIKLAIKTIPKCAPKSDFQQFSVGDQQTLRLLQRRRSINNSIDETNVNDSPPVKDRKLHLCVLCPYTNQRQDSLINHYKRHGEDLGNVGHNKCPHCQLSVVQSHFLREHIKSHFTYQKNLTPNCFVANENVTFTITKLDDENEKSDFILESDNFDQKIEERIYVQMSTGDFTVDCCT